MHEFLDFPMFPNRLPLELAMAVNIKEPEIKRIPNMFNVLDEIESAEISELIDPTTNIVLVTPSDDKSIKRTIDGSLSIVAVNGINLSSCKTLINSLSVLPIVPRLKVIVPRGIRLDFETPVTSSYYNKIYKYIKIEQRANDENETPEYMIYHDLSFTIHIDLAQLKIVNKVINIKPDTELIDLKFSPVYYIGSPNFPNIEQTVLIKNTEVFSKLEEIF